MASKKKEVPLYGVIDERTKAVANQGDAYSAKFLLFALLLDVFVRGLQLNDPFTASNWDLMLIVIVGGLISTAYQYKQKILLTRPSSKLFIAVVSVMGLAAVVSLFASKLFAK